MTLEEMDNLCATFNAHAHDEGTGYFSNTREQDISRHLDFANREMDMHGVEAVTLEGMVYPVLLYVNTGEAYEATIVYSVPDDLFFVSSWGDAFEEMERRQEQGGI